MKKGSVITVYDFVFLDGFLDEEWYQRKCIILFDEDREDGKYYCVVPVVQQISSFNAHPERYYLLQLTNHNGKKILFAKLSSAVYIHENDIEELVTFVDSDTIKRMIEKTKNNYLEYEQSEYYENVLHTIEERSCAVK